MFWLDDPRTVFVHIPRTAGIAITRHVGRRRAGESAVIADSWFPPGLRRHARATHLATFIPDWNESFRFAVARNPWRLAESDYRYWRARRDEIPTSRETAETDPRQNIAHEIVRACLPFSPWILSRYQFLPPGGGFWSHFCLGDNDADLGVRSYLFEELPTWWPALCQQLRLPDEPLQSANQAPDAPIQWTDAAIAFFGERVIGDCHRFDYPQTPFT